MMGMMLIASVQRNCQALLIHVAQTKRVGRQPRAKPSGGCFSWSLLVLETTAVCPEGFALG